MRIAQVAPPFESVPPSRYGGTERVIATLTEELVRRGHDVTLFATGDSRTSARLVPVADEAVWHHEPPYPDFSPFWAIVVGRLLGRLGEFDVVHSHLDFWGFPLARMAPCPVVTTLHGRLDLPELVPLYREFTDVPVVSISDAQRGPVPNARWVATVYHGIDLDQLTFKPTGGEYLAFLGRISPEKGLDTAIRIAQRAGMPLKVAARGPMGQANDPNVRRDRQYFDEVVKPLLQGEQVEMGGEVGGVEKDAFLRSAAALLFPVCWPEPFGLVMAEALACGTPVLALRNGSVPEIIVDGVTGYVRDTENELVEAVGRLSALDRAVCRDEAVRRFSPAAMAEQYEQIYTLMIEEHRLASRAREALARDGTMHRDQRAVPVEPLYRPAHGSLDIEGVSWGEHRSPHGPPRV